MAGLLLGLEDFVHYIMRDERPSLFFLRGFDRLQQGNKQFLVQAAITAWVAEGVLSEIMTDPRIGTTYPARWQTLAQDVAWLLQLPDSLWASLRAV